MSERNTLPPIDLDELEPPAPRVNLRDPVRTPIPPVPPTPAELARDAMITDKYDRGFEPAAIRWAIFSPGMYDELRLATDEDVAACGYFDAELELLAAAKPGDWIRYKEGIAIRLGACIEPTE